MQRRKALGLPSRALDRNVKQRLWVRARALTHRTVKGRHYGELTAKYLEVFRVLLFEFHNAGSGRCFPSYDRICEAARCSRQTVANAIAAFERVGLMEVWNRVLRVRWFDCDAGLSRTRVVRTSNSYVFDGPPSAERLAVARSSKSRNQTGTENQVSSSSLENVLERLRKGVAGDLPPRKLA